MRVSQLLVVVGVFGLCSCSESLKSDESAQEQLAEKDRQLAAAEHQSAERIQALKSVESDLQSAREQIEEQARTIHALEIELDVLQGQIGRYEQQIARSREQTISRIEMLEWETERDVFRRTFEASPGSRTLYARIDEMRERAYATDNLALAREYLLENKRLLEQFHERQLGKMRELRRLGVDAKPPDDDRFREVANDLIEIEKKALARHED